VVDVDVLTFADLVEDWRAIVGRRGEEPPVEVWERTFEQLKTAQRRLVADGVWVSGYFDLMHLARVADRELAHSNMVAWLLDPAGRHRLGDRLLTALMEEGWRVLRMPQTDGALVEREVVLGGRIADVVVYMGPVTLVIENKVWAQESLRQCEDLYQIWSDSDYGSDVRFLLLTLDGHPPRETTSEAAASAWRSLAYPSLGGWLNANLPASPQSIGERTVEQYVSTIRETCRGTRPLEIRIGGGKVGG